MVRVVLRAEDGPLASKVTRYTHDIVMCQDSALGMGHSLAAGIAGLTWEWAFVGLLDMPFVTAQTLQALSARAQAIDSPAIIRPRLDQRLRYQGKDRIPYGHPIGWHHSYFEALTECQGDQGARTLLRRYSAQIIEVEVGDPGIVMDIDTPADLLQNT